MKPPKYPFTLAQYFTKTIQMCMFIFHGMVVYRRHKQEAQRAGPFVVIIFRMMNMDKYSWNLQNPVESANSEKPYTSYEAPFF